MKDIHTVGFVISNNKRIISNIMSYKIYKIKI